ncbi:hypothetical protein EJB05_30133, partial [Eragrostis curvula]
MWTESPLLRDVGAALLTAVVAAAVLRFWEVVANRELLDQVSFSLASSVISPFPIREFLLFWCELVLRSQLKSKKMVHITVGFAYFLMWPLFSSDDVYAPFLAPLIIELNIVKVTLIGLGIVKDEGVVNSMTRHGDRRELLKGPLYYACAVTLTTIIFWRTSPISIAVLCNLFAGDGVADIVGRRLGHAKLPHNNDKSYAGSIAMFIAGFIASALLMCYFHHFGFVEQSWRMVLAFGVISFVAAVVESLPISTRLDDNLTVTLASALVGALVFHFIGVRNLCCMNSDGSNISAIVQMVFAGSSSK